MTLDIARSASDHRIVVSVYNASTAAAISSGEIVRLSTGSTPNIYAVTRIGTTAGTAIRLFGVCEHAIATGQVGDCVIHGPAIAVAAAAITVKAPLTASNSSTSTLKGRAEVASGSSTSGLADLGSYIGWAMKTGSTGAFTEIFVNTAHTPVV